MSITYQCDNCDSTDAPAKTLFQIHHLSERLDPGMEVPAGECSCGSLTYQVPAPGLLEIVRELSQWYDESHRYDGVGPHRDGLWLLSEETWSEHVRNVLAKAEGGA